MGEYEHLDVEALQELREVMEDEFSVLIDTYIKDSVVRISSIHKAIEQGDSDALRKAAHSFKGSCGNIGAPRLADLCRQLEEAGREGTVSGLEDLVAKIDQEYGEVKQLMEGM